MMGMPSNSSRTSGPRGVCLRNKDPRLRDSAGRPTFNLCLYAINKLGEYGASNIWSGGQFAVADENGVRLESAAFLYQSG
jgi:hypothetical protein